MTSLNRWSTIALITILTHGACVMAQENSTDGGASERLTAAGSDPIALGWMQGFPPPADGTIRFTDPDYFAFPRLRWTVCHFRELMPTVAVPRGAGVIARMQSDIDTALDAVSFSVQGSDRTMSWDDAFDANFSDGVIVLHQGRIVYERYAGCLQEDVLHGAMSMTKSLTGLLGEILVAEGALDETAAVGTLIPELKDSAFGDATVRQVMDMTTSLDYSEDYADPDADVWVYAQAGSPLPKPDDYDGPRSYFEFLATVRPDPDTAHGMTFGYKTVNADALGWLIARATGRSVADNLAERVWAPLGAQREGFYTVDSIGTPFAGGGFNATLRDMARLGQLMLDGGRSGDEQIVPPAAIDSIRGGGDTDAFARSGHPDLIGWSYRSMWWITGNEHGAYAARGVHGQTVYIDPTANMVIARFASHPVAANAGNDATSLPAYQAIAEHLMASPAGRGLSGGEWIVEDIDGGGVIDNPQASLSFTRDGRLSGHATCNRLLGSFTLDDANSPLGGAIAFEQLGVTRMACPEALMHQENALLEALDKIDRFLVDETGVLLLQGGDTRISAHRR